MLLLTKDPVLFHISHDGADYHALKMLTRSSGEGEGPVSFRNVLFPFLEHGGDVGRFPVPWYSARLHSGSVDQS